MSRDLESWMWAEAVRMLDRAERVQRHFFRPGTPRAPQWEPPVDVYETEQAVLVVAALPGVAADRMVVNLRDNVLTVAGERSVPPIARAAALHRMEIPHGRFERRLALHFGALELAEQELLDGCLVVRLRKL